MAYQPDEDPFAQENKKGPHTLDPMKIDKLTSIATAIAMNFALARTRLNEGFGPGAHMAYSGAEHLVHDLTAELGIRYSAPKKPPIPIPDSSHLENDRLKAAASGAYFLRRNIMAADEQARVGNIEDAYMSLGDAHNALNEIAKALGFKLVWSPELVSNKASFASSGAGGAVTGGR